MTKFFYELTKRNWGWPYHVLLADLGTVAGLIILSFFRTSMPFLWHVGLVWLVMNTIGYLNEVIQGEKGRGFWEDIIANNCGIILGALKVHYVMAIVRVWNG